MERLRLALFGAAALVAGAAHAADPAPPPARSFCAPPALGIEPLDGRRMRSVTEFGAVGDGKTDDTRALQAALDGVPAGTVLSFPPGTYLTSNVLTLSRGGVVLRGDRAVLRATVPARQALVLAGDRTALVGLTLEGAARRRLTTQESAQVLVRGQWVQVVGNTISGAASVGIFVDGARDFRISGNRVSATKADGIHMTGGARNGLVEGNVVFGTGDDLIAVVSYRPNRPNGGNAGLSGHILIEGNRVWGNSWGRGITVVGGHDVAIIRNEVRKVPSAAGIYLAQESSYRTYGDRDILVAGNTIADIQTVPSPSGHGHPRHGAIDINTSNQAPMEYIDVENNVVEGAGYAGIRLLGQVCHIRLAGNTLNSVQRSGHGRPIEVIRDLFHGTCPDGTLECQGNSADGRPAADGQCAAATAVAWRGAPAQAAAPHGAAWDSCAR